LYYKTCYSFEIGKETTFNFDIIIMFKHSTFLLFHLPLDEDAKYF